MTVNGMIYRIDRDDLLARVSLTQVLDSLTPGHGDGHRRRWRCPEPGHADEHPSVTVTRDRHGTERWRCWSGGHGGTAIDAVIAAKQLGIGESIRWLNDHHAHLRPMPPDTSSTRERTVGQPSPHVVAYVERCEQLLRTRAGVEVRSWLHGRGLGDDILAANRVGADPGRRLLPRQRGLPTGRPAAVFPSLDRSGNITYFQARFLDPGENGQKYANPAQQLAANPTLAWTQRIRSADADEVLIITEGIPDALIAAQAGIKSVAVLGSAASSQNVATQLIDAVSSCHRRPSVIVCFDADEAGRAGAARLAHHLGDQGERASVVEPPADLDITDWAAADARWTDQLDGVHGNQVGGRVNDFTTSERQPEVGVDVDL